MRLHYSPASPYARKCLVVLHETGQFDAAEVVPAATNALARETPVAANPLGKVPVLERADGPALYDSRVICRYLNDRAGARLYPAAPLLWDSLVLEATADGILDAALLMVYELRLRPQDRQWPDWIEGQWHKITRALDRCEQDWAGHLEGPLDIGQIALGCALGYLDLRHDARQWRAGRPQLARWFAGFAARPGMVASAPPA